MNQRDHLSETRSKRDELHRRLTALGNEIAEEETEVALQLLIDGEADTWHLDHLKELRRQVRERARLMDHAVDLATAGGEG